MQNLCVQNYQGNNRMVVNATTNAVEQDSHYYPYGGLMADISTGLNLQPFEYSGKKLERFGGLDLYDFEARQQDPLLGCFTSIDPLAHKNPWASPYTYCNGDPVNQVDPDGRIAWWVTGLIGGIIGATYSACVHSDKEHAAFWSEVAGGFVSGFLMGSGAGLLSSGTVAFQGTSAAVFAKGITWNAGWGYVSGFSGSLTTQGIQYKYELVDHISLSDANLNGLCNAATAAATYAATTGISKTVTFNSEEPPVYSEYALDHMSKDQLREIATSYDPSVIYKRLNNAGLKSLILKYQNEMATATSKSQQLINDIGDVILQPATNSISNNLYEKSK